ncbi:DNA (cytosine-5-)-methyltransferase [Parathermosynechococcus lividus PCC 6715]|uniref:Cytosine-specific methyltransferase n=1 Tax=Parathermosynechococcus lividus PCC 6715 TaxID=1917166 RepID=A0A2D2Q0T9_PARLV|nr:DNA (cytosine-5-)-methyltransferase [Thermostichus lividus]ATS18135.1 DNA (cytosine-5-)-methyltransferase [Thermostichus lividus PCC 6715]
MTSLTFIDLFAGIGGMRLAFTQAGARCVFSSEWNKFAQITYAANFSEMPAGDITQITTDEIPEHDILLAGFPCQPFSIAGVSKHNALGVKHGFDHPTQGNLFFEIVRILADKKPKAFLLENVKNLQSHDQGRTFKIIQRILNELGYYIYYQVIDAVHFVPQHRERIFIAGFKEPIEFAFPDLPIPYLRVKDILEFEVAPKYTLTDHLWQYLQKYAEKHRAKGNGFGYGIVNLDGFTRTLSARYYKDGSEILIPQVNQNPRRLTPRECARLMGFPDSFKIVVSDTRAYQQFGNSVVVPLVRAIAHKILEALNHRNPLKTTEQLNLF